MSKKPKTADNEIVVNRKARHEYFTSDTIEAGIALQGWEVKSLRAKRIQLTESYILIKDGEAWLFGCLVTPLPTASTHITPEPLRSRKLLLHRKELNQLIGAVERKGFTVIPLKLYWKGSLAKVLVAIAEGKKDHDKRESEKERDWERDRQRLMRHATRG
ncbi:MAG: SsrA-binding protein SmpB [Gammaproteobacteria bacterium]|nr:SsrA-binding protein SmpB [Gammaproteobacteria bacterium]